MPSTPQEGPEHEGLHDLERDKNDSDHNCPSDRDLRQLPEQEDAQREIREQDHQADERRQKVIHQHSSNHKNERDEPGFQKVAIGILPIEEKHESEQNQTIQNDRDHRRSTRSAACSHTKLKTSSVDATGR